MPRPPLRAQPNERTAKEDLGALPPNPPLLDPDMKEDEHPSEQIFTGKMLHNAPSARGVSC